MSEEKAKRLAADPSVARVEADGAAYATGTQPNPPSYGLDRIDQRNLPLDRSLPPRRRLQCHGVRRRLRCPYEPRRRPWASDHREPYRSPHRYRGDRRAPVPVARTGPRNGGGAPPRAVVIGGDRRAGRRAARRAGGTGGVRRPPAPVDGWSAVRGRGGTARMARLHGVPRRRGGGAAPARVRAPCGGGADPSPSAGGAAGGRRGGGPRRTRARSTAAVRGWFGRAGDASSTCGGAEGRRPPAPSATAGTPSPTTWRAGPRTRRSPNRNGLFCICVRLAPWPGTRVPSRWWGWPSTTGAPPPRAGGALPGGGGRPGGGARGRGHGRRSLPRRPARRPRARGPRPDRAEAGPRRAERPARPAGARSAAAGPRAPLPGPRAERRDPVVAGPVAAQPVGFRAGGAGRDSASGPRPPGRLDRPGRTRAGDHGHPLAQGLAGRRAPPPAGRGGTAAARGRGGGPALRRAGQPCHRPGPDGRSVGVGGGGGSARHPCR
ncbi:hypothetical protein SBADM41S_06776 [Streptomyces badius]